MKPKTLSWEVMSVHQDGDPLVIFSGEMQQMHYDIRPFVLNGVRFYGARFFHGWVRKDCTEFVGNFDTLDQAKEACQVHFNDYITKHYLGD